MTKKNSLREQHVSPWSMASVGDDGFMYRVKWLQPTPDRLRPGGTQYTWKPTGEVMSHASPPSCGPAKIPRRCRSLKTPNTSGPPIRDVHWRFSISCKGRRWMTCWAARMTNGSGRCWNTRSGKHSSQSPWNTASVICAGTLVAALMSSGGITCWM